MKRKISLTLLLYYFLFSSLGGQDLFEQSNDSLVQEIDETYRKGLQFLAESQEEAGCWTDSSYGSQPGVVGMTILAFLARGDDPEFGPYRLYVKRAMDFLLKQQNQETGYIGSSMYNHGFATLALAEAYGLTNDLRLGPALEKASKLIVSSQKSNPKGGWRYSPDSQDADSTISGAQLVALFAARNAGIKVPEEAIEKGKAFLLSCQDTNGGFGYTAASGANLPRSAIGSLILSLAKDTNTDAYRNSVEFLKENSPFGDQGHKYYSLYYTSQAMFRASPSMWNTWNSQNFKRLQSTQTENGSWNGNYGQTFATSAALLSLALNYRYLPIYER
jgi:prenyltransferase beta subunit